MPPLFEFWEAAIAVFPLVMGCFGLMALINNWRRADAMQSWLPVNAKILHSRVERERGDEGYLWAPRVRYRYEVDGSAYESTQIGLATWRASIRGPAQRVAMRYPANKQLICFVNPEDPSEAYLDKRKPQIETLLVALISLLAIGFGIFQSLTYLDLV